MIIFREVQLFSPSRWHAAYAVSGIPFFFNFSLAFTGARNVALDRSMVSFLLRCGSSADMLKLAILLLLACLCCGAMSGPSRECTLLLLSHNCVKTFLSLGPSLVNTVAFTGLLWRVGFSLSCLSLEKALAFCEGRVPLDVVTGLSLLFLGLLFLSHDSDSENWDLIVVFFANFMKFICGEVPRITVRRVSLSDAWVTGRGSPYYPVDNKVIDVRNVDVLPRHPITAELVLLVGVCGLCFLADPRDSCFLWPRADYVPCGSVELLGHFGSFQVLGLGQLPIMWSGLAARMILHVITYDNI
ncbi:hypothetical protein Tco_1124561 [Tanacetum coccineum]|uniref:Uncharacterized protein n=1 Tax=Tanacetum coccineum TaxID=301880 RepID=A0ABQ5J754_9ASTR